MSGSRWRRAVAVVGSAAFAACVFHDGKKPAGDSGIIPDVPPDVAPECLDTSVTCVNGMVRDCSMGGSAKVTSCDFGCVETSGAHCGTFLPYGGAVGSADVVMAVGSDLDLTADTVIDSNNGKNVTANTTWPFFRLDTISGMKIGVFRADNITIGSGATVTFLAAAGGKPSVAFVASGDITINGTIDGRPTTTCSGRTPGPGGFPGAANNAPANGSGGGQGANNAADEGGAGGGYGGVGGDGGNGPTGGPAFGDQLITLLVGGGGGGGGGTGNGGDGGGGGAAIQLVAGGTITITGTINAGGCGGLPGDNNESGGGGGAGGSILLEAKSIVVSGILAANGAGGGGGGTNQGAAARGAPGDSSTTAAAGGMGNANGGLGGAGATVDGAPGAHVGGVSGGGGGGVGRIRINTLDGTSNTTGATLSPDLGSGAGARTTKGQIRVQ